MPRRELGWSPSLKGRTTTLALTMVPRVMVSLVAATKATSDAAQTGGEDHTVRYGTVRYGTVQGPSNKGAACGTHCRPAGCSNTAVETCEFEENELLMTVAAEADPKLFGPKAEVNMHECA